MASLEALAEALRDPDTWPPGFKWDFSDPSHGPIGLLIAKWGGTPTFNPYVQEYVASWGRTLGITPQVVRKLFLSKLPYWYRPFGFPLFPRPARLVTPEIAARVIERQIGR